MNALDYLTAGFALVALVWLIVAGVKIAWAYPNYDEYKDERSKASPGERR